jgi:DNA-binding IclR family transcriptional regulator
MKQESHRADGLVVPDELREREDRPAASVADRVLDVLLAFDAGHPARTLAELVATTGLPRATVFRLTQVLQARGFLAKNGPRFTLGHQFLVLGAVASAGLDLRALALPYLQSLRDATGETSQVAVLDGLRIVYIERVLSQRAVAYMRSRAGTVLPAWCTGLGKAMLAFAAPDALASQLRTAQLERFTPRTLTGDELLSDLAVVRERGFAIDDEEREVGVRCVAAPVRDAAGRVIAAISVAGPAGRIPADLPHSELARLVVTAAANLSRDLGYEDL